MIESNCASDCTADGCRDLFLTLRVVHDDCPHGVLTDAAERGLHDLESACADVVCNAGGRDDDPLTCGEADRAGHDDHGGEFSPSPFRFGWGPFLFCLNRARTFPPGSIPSLQLNLCAF